MLGHVDHDQKPENETHIDQQGDEHDDSEYPIDFANVVQNIFEQYNQEDQEVPSDQPLSKENEPESAHGHVNEPLEEDKQDNHNDEEEETNLQNILAQLAHEGLEKVHDPSSEAEKIVEMVPSQGSEILPESQQIPESEQVVPESEEQVRDEEAHVTDDQVLHELELQDAIAQALRSTDLGLHLSPEVETHPEPTPKRKEERIDRKPQPSVSQAPAPPHKFTNNVIFTEPETISSVQRSPQVSTLPKKVVEAKTVKTAPAAHAPLKTVNNTSIVNKEYIDSVPEKFLGELEALAGESEHSDDLQLAIAQMVKNVVEGNDFNLDNDSDFDSSNDEDEGLHIDQSQMNDILQNALQIAKHQQSNDLGQKDKNLEQHRAALDDAISSLFNIEKAKLKQMTKLRKESIASVPNKKIELGTAKTSTLVLDQHTSLKVPTKKPLQNAVKFSPSELKQTRPLSEKHVEPVYKPQKTIDLKSQVVIPATAPTDSKLADLKTKTDEPQISIIEPGLKVTEPLVGSSSVAAKAKKPVTVVDSTSKQKKKPKLSIAETLALTRSSMKTAPKRDYSNIESIEQVLRTSEPPKQPGVTTFHSSSAKKSNLAEAIEQMSNALQTPSAQKLKQIQFSASRVQPVPTSSSSTSTGNKSTSPAPSPEELINALLAAREFIAQQSDKSETSETLNVLDTAIDSLKKPEAGQSSPSLLSKIDDSIGNLTQNNAPAIVQKSTLVPTSLTRAFTNYTGTLVTSRSKSGQLRKKLKPDEPESKERLRQSNRERKKKWREINSERNKDNDLRFRVVKRANQLFGELESDEKSQWITNEVEKRRKKRLERSSSKPIDYDYRYHKTESPDPMDFKRENSSKSSLSTRSILKGFIDAFGQGGLNLSQASAMGASAILAIKSNPTNQQQITNAITDVISSMASKSMELKAAAAAAAAANSSLKTSDSVARAVEQPVSGDSSSLSTSDATTKTSDISSSMEKMKIDQAHDENNFTTSKPLSNEKRKSEVELISEDLKKPRSVSPSPKLIMRTTSESLKDSSTSVSTELKDHKVGGSIASSSIPPTPIRTPTVSYQSSPAVVEPFKALWPSRAAFKLPQYKKPVSEYQRASSATPPPRIKAETPITPAANTEQRGPLQRPAFSKPPAFQRPKW